MTTAAVIFGAVVLWFVAWACWWRWSGVTACEHAWKRAGPVVVVVNDALAREKGGTTYNAECERCGKRTWLHWVPA